MRAGASRRAKKRDLAAVWGIPQRNALSAAPDLVPSLTYTDVAPVAEWLERVLGLRGLSARGDNLQAREGGQSRVTACASVIDMETNDPTYVPAQ